MESKFQINDYSIFQVKRLEQLNKTYCKKLKFAWQYYGLIYMLIDSRILYEFWCHEDRKERKRGNLCKSSDTSNPPVQVIQLRNAITTGNYRQKVSNFIMSKRFFLTYFQ